MAIFQLSAGLPGRSAIDPLTCRLAEPLPRRPELVSHSLIPSVPRSPKPVPAFPPRENPSGLLSLWNEYCGYSVRGYECEPPSRASARSGSALGRADPIRGFSPREPRRARRTGAPASPRRMDSCRPGALQFRQSRVSAAIPGFLFLPPFRNSAQKEHGCSRRLGRRPPSTKNLAVLPGATAALHRRRTGTPPHSAGTPGSSTAAAAGSPVPEPAASTPAIAGTPRAPSSYR